MIKMERTKKRDCFNNIWMPFSSRHISYRLTSATTTKDPNYCSKLVFQSFYYGSGSAEVIEPAFAGLNFVSPAALPNTFKGKYVPYKVGTY